MSRVLTFAISLALASASHGQPSDPPSSSESRVFLMDRAANRLRLGDGSTIEIVGSTNVSKTGSYESGFARIAGDVYTIAAATGKCDRTELRISSGKTEMLVRADIRFADDKLPVPIVLDIAGEQYRLFWGEGTFAPAARRRANEAVEKLPSRFVSALRTLWGLASQIEDGVPPHLNFLEALFDEPVPEVLVLEKAPLNPKEVENLTREAGVRK